MGTEAVLSKRRVNKDLQLYLVPSELSVSSGDYSMGGTLHAKTTDKMTEIASGVLFVSTSASSVAG